MKIFKNLLITAVAILIAGNSHAMEKPSYNYFKQPKIAPATVFAQNMVDKTTKKILDEKGYQANPLRLSTLPDNIAATILRYSGCLNHTRILEKDNLVMKKVSTFFLENGSSRILGAQLINRCACENNLSIRAPEQRCYRDPNGNLWIIAPRIIPSNRPFSLAQMKDLFKLAQLTGYHGDIYACNIFNTQEGNAFAIDTEEKSFSNWPMAETSHSRLRERFSSFILEPAANDWVNRKLDKIAVIQETAKQLITAAEQAKLKIRAVANYTLTMIEYRILK